MNTRETVLLTTNITVSVSSDYGTLHGTLDLPEGSFPVPVLLVIAGSGPTDRDGNSEMIKKHNDSLKMLGARLASMGVAVLRYDKRGIGESKAASGPVEQTVFEDMIKDARLWIDFLKGDDRFSSVGILGHSEGSLIGMCVAEKGGVDLFVSVAGAGRPAEEVLKSQLSDQPGFVRKKALPLLGRYARGDKIEKVPFYLKNLFKPELQPYFISWAAYDPAAIIGNLNLPVLILQGETDLQTSSKDAELLAGANAAARLEIIPGMNHILKDAPAKRLKNMMTYTKEGLPLSGTLVTTLENYLKDQDWI